jgi:hypothetical protein
MAYNAGESESRKINDSKGRSGATRTSLGGGFIKGKILNAGGTQKQSRKESFS